MEASNETPHPISTRKNVLYNTCGCLVYQGCQWLTTVLVVNLLGGFDASGVLAFAMSIGNMLYPLASFSMRAYQASDVSHMFSSHNYVAFRLVTVLASLAAFVPYAFVASPSGEALPPVLLFLLFKCDEAFCDVLYGIDQGAQRMDYIGVSQFLRGVLLLALFVVTLGLLGSLSAGIAGMALACIGVTVFYDVPHAQRISPLEPRIDGTRVRSLVRQCLPLVISTLFMSSVVSIARQCYLWLFGFDALGRYAAVATPAVLVQALVYYLYMPMLVPLARRRQMGPSAFGRLFFQTLGLLVAAMAVITVAGGVFGERVLVLIYGADIAEYAYLFPSVLVSTCLISILWFLVDVLVVCRATRDILVSTGLALLSCLVLMVPLEMGLGMNGINVTVIGAMAVGVVAAAGFVLRHIGDDVREGA